MIWLIGLIVLETIVEGLYCSGLWRDQAPLRKMLGAVLAITLIVYTVSCCILAWQVWVWAIPLSLYRLVNILRVYHNRLPERQLRTVSVRAFTWLVAVQSTVVAFAWAVTRYGAVLTFFDVLVVLQLLSAVILLRASTHTWRHAAMPGEPTPLTDKELPTVSVLVPARNETDELEECLRSIVASDYPKLEVVVLDDCSANRRTPEIIRSFAHDGVRFVQGEVPDETRWLAKNYAYEQLVRASSGDIVLFCGVDARFEPHSVRQLIGVLTEREKDMLSVMPLRAAADTQGNSLLQAMRYYWEICLPRRFFKRPPVLSTCWLIRRTALERMGGFESVSRSVTPEAPLARKAVVTDAYSFLRSDERLGIYSEKSSDEQYATSVRVRYPQLHRRLEFIALATLYELVFLLGPIVGLFFVGFLAHSMAYVALWTVTLLCLLTTYGIVATGARLTDPWYGWALMPVAAFMDIVMLNVSLWKYEFGSVEWKGRNVCIPVMQVIPKLPKA